MTPLASIELTSLGSLVHHLVQRLVLSHESHTEAFRTLCRELPPLAQRKVLYTVLKTLSEQHLSCLGKCESDDSKPMICAVAGAICSMVGTDGPGRSHLIDWSTSSTGAGLGEGVGIRRAVVAAIAQDKDSIVAVFEQSLRQFGDPLYVKHAPTLQQEGQYVVVLVLEVRTTS